MNAVTWFYLSGGLGLLIVGAELLVRHSSQLAVRLGISPLLVGLTVVAYGTSTPELIVSLQTGFSGQSDISLGNVVGSNISNVLLILGTCAMIAPLFVAQQIVRWDVPVMILVSCVLFAAAWDGTIGRFDGILLISGIFLYTWFVVKMSKKEAGQVKEEYEKEFGKRASSHSKKAIIFSKLLWIAVSLLAVILGAKWFVDGSVQIARLFGISELVIGLTVVAIGTGLPEIATSIVATLRGERDIAVGNIVGSNIYNILAVVGLTAVLAPEGIQVSKAALNFDIPVMVAVSVACFPIFFTGHLIARWEGTLFFGYYVSYVCYLLFQSTQHDALPIFSSIMFAFIIPITVVTIFILFIRSIKPSSKINL